MDNNQLKATIINILKQDDRLWNKEKTELNQTRLLDLIDDIDEKVIEILLQEKQIRKKYFTKIKDIYVFKSNDFKFFMEENKVNNSYTKYKNRIGLTDGKRFLNDNKDVVLNFPYKDCVLEGGQSTEEGMDAFFNYEEEKTKTIKGEKLTEPARYKEKQSKRKEIFFNEFLAHDEIDRLFDEKALAGWKRFTKDGEQGVKEIKRDENGTIKENLIIKGNNLLALHSLKKQFTGKIKLIYIDPPYYFAKKSKNNDTFAYNTNFKLSTWLIFLKNRLEIAKDLLKDDGIIFISIDDGGQPYLKVLLDEIFGSTNFIANLPTIMNLKGNNDEFGFSGTHEYTIVYAKNIYNAKLFEFPIDEEKIYKNWHEDGIGYFKKGANLKATGTNAPRNKRKNLFYPIFINQNNKVYVTDNDKSENINDFTLLPITDNNEMSWRWEKKKVKNEAYNIIVVKNNGKISLYKKQRPQLGDLPTKKPKTIFYKPEYSSGNGTRQIKEFFGYKIFNNPKPMELIKDFIILGTKESDIILDYHAGSGTTAHAVLKLNKEDEGKRNFILVEQIDYINTVTCPRVHKVMEKENINDSFLYFELAKWNEKAKEKILACESLPELEDFFDTLYEKYFLNYNLKTKEFKEKIIEEDNFKKLSLDEQKKMFISMLDLNQMYVQKTEMADKKFNINKNDQKLTEEFYNFRG